MLRYVDFTLRRDVFPQFEGKRLTPGDSLVSSQPTCEIAPERGLTVNFQLTRFVHHTSFPLLVDFDIKGLFIHCCVRCRGPFGLAQLLGGERTAMERRPYRFGHAGRVTGDPRLCLTSLGGAGWCGRRRNAVPTAGSDRSVASPNGRAGARPSRCGRNKLRPSRGFGPVAGTWCRSSPRNRVTKSRTRRCQRTILRSPSQFLSKGTRESISHSSAQRKRGFGKLKFCGRFEM